MPREHKKRGRRAEQKKRKLDEEQEGGDDVPHSKRQKQDDATVEEAAFIALPEGERQWVQESTEATTSAPEMPFYGMLDEHEQNYFRQADERLELNAFAGPEDRSLFLAALHREAQGKELKMACSQSSSRLLERLIRLSTAAQLKQLFAKFIGQ